MTLYGMPGDVNNRVPFSSVYPGGRAAAYVPPAASSLGFRNNSMGELSALGSDVIAGRMPGGMAARAANGNGTASSMGVFGKPTSWWLMFAIVFFIFVWVARKYGTGDGAPVMGNIKMTVYNGLFLTFFIVLMLNLLKVFAAKIKVPGVSDLILAA